MALPVLHLDPAALRSRGLVPPVTPITDRLDPRQVPAAIPVSSSGHLLWVLELNTAHFWNSKWVLISHFWKWRLGQFTQPKPTQQFSFRDRRGSWDSASAAVEQGNPTSGSS